MKTVATPMARLKITVPVKCGGSNVYTESKICNTAKSAAMFYANVKTIGRQQELEHSTGIQRWQSPSMWSMLDARYQRQYTRALKVFKQYLP